MADPIIPGVQVGYPTSDNDHVYIFDTTLRDGEQCPGATMTFRTRLASPPTEAHAVLVRFFNRRDLLAGVQ